ncbi:calcium/proton exchanger [Exophiala spinifera]|uniref:Calcium/proton exchanger n=1 Tax=Exophiala spinifera TaxID=91928 RepID=A0A0D2BDT7_9EURO|nr:calcium/proton exchanger [Exophiala spinifera]KIW17113.1 calcium/proton exchanger [Exophiala spinifera]
MSSSETPGRSPAKSPVLRFVPDVQAEATAGEVASGTIRRDYGTLGSVQASASQRPPGPRVDDVSDLPPLSPQLSRPKKPPTMRRTSTRTGKLLPHRGEQFSVDDDPSEVEEANSMQPGPSASRQQSTVRRRTHPATLTRVDSAEEEAEETAPEQPTEADAEEPLDDTEAGDLGDNEEEELSDAESFTLRDRQLAINQTHPFGIRIWKPALYKKGRSVEKAAEEDIHSSPSQIVSPWLWFFNCLWTVFFGWWLAVSAAIAAFACYLFAFDPSAAAYGRVFLGLSNYLFWPFGKFVKLVQDENYVEEDEGEGRSISEYERWQSGDLEYGRLMFGPTFTHSGSIVGRHRNSIDSASETDSLLARSGRTDRQDTTLSNKKRRLFGRGQWTLGRVIFFVFYYFFVAPLLLFASGICWFMVFWIPMGRVTLILFSNLRKRPLSMTFHRDVSAARSSTKPSSILLCTYRAVGKRYWKYTIDGTNIFLINFLAVVVFVILDYFVLKVALGVNFWLTSPALTFTLALISIIPLAYFIGQAVASISAQSSMGMGAAVNAFFSTVVEVYLYCIALNEGKAALVEGSIIGSIFAGILLLPGLSMCFGAIKRKTQRFNVKSAGATSTMLLFATIAAFCPTLFYKIYGSHEIICRSCTTDDSNPNDCRQCYFRQLPAITDEFYVKAVRPYCWMAAIFLFSSYIIGLLFTLRTHAAIIWSTDLEEKKPSPAGQVPTDISPLDTRNQSVANSQFLNNPNGYVPKTAIRESQLYKRILGQSLRSAGLSAESDTQNERERPVTPKSVLHAHDGDQSDLPHLVPPKSSHGTESLPSPEILPFVPSLSEEENNYLVRQVAEIAATAATVAARDAVNHPRTAAYQASHASRSDTVKTQRPSNGRKTTMADQDAFTTPATEHAVPHEVSEQSGQGGHDAPNWSRTKSSVILLTATVAYAIVAEILVDTVDVVLESVDIDEKFLGITLFALVPNTTEFLNAISFAMNGNIALSMEIGSAYALQVCLLQLPALVLFSAVQGQWIDAGELIDHTFNLIFPQWDMVTVILCVFLLSYMSGEGKSNYFKGSILVMTYLVVVMGYYFSGFTTLTIMETSAWQSGTPGPMGVSSVRPGREL